MHVPLIDLFRHHIEYRSGTSLLCAKIVSYVKTAVLQRDITAIEHRQAHVCENCLALSDWRSFDALGEAAPWKIQQCGSRIHHVLSLSHSRHPVPILRGTHMHGREQNVTYVCSLSPAQRPQRRVRDGCVLVLLCALCGRVVLVRLVPPLAAQQQIV